jgi:hypothetical protein
MGVDKLRKEVYHPQTNNKALLKDLTATGATSCCIDMSSWVHKFGCHVCQELLADQRPEALHGARHSLGKHLAGLKNCGVKRVHFVRDGQNPPAKFPVVEARTQARQLALTAAQDLHAALPENPTTEDKKALLAACKKAVGRPLWLEQGLCAFLSTASCPGFEVTWEVALFEADAQIALLFSMNLFDFVICEDQDLLVYGVDLMVAGWSPTTGMCVVTDLRAPTTFPLSWCAGAACTGLVGKKKQCPECSAGAGLTRIQVRDASILTSRWTKASRKQATYATLCSSRVSATTSAPRWCSFLPDALHPRRAWKSALRATTTPAAVTS